MATGKHKRRRANRAAAELVERARELIAERDEQQRRRDVAYHNHQTAERMVEQRRRLEYERDSLVAEELARVTAEVDRLRQEKRFLDDVRGRTSNVWEALCDHIVAVERAEGATNIEAVEGLARRLGALDHGRFVRTKEVASESLPIDAAARIDVARGARRPDTTREALAQRNQQNERNDLFTLLRRPVPRAVTTSDLVNNPDDPVELDEVTVGAVDHIPAELRNIPARDRWWRNVEHTRAADIDDDALFGWNLPPWFRPAPDGAWEQFGSPLGAVMTDSPVQQWNVNTRSLDDTFDAAFELDAAVVAEAGRVPLPWTALPRLARARDAVALRRWHTSSAVGMWLRTAETSCSGDVDVDDPATWRTASPDADRLASVARLVCDAVPFWLPVQQASSLADSAPLDDDMLADLRMPFMSTMVAFAQPLRIDPDSFTGTHAATPDLADQLDLCLSAVAKEPDGPLGDTLIDFISSLREDACSLPELAAVLGAHVEGLVFTANAAGELRDEFIWLLVIPSMSPGLVHARLPVPALRSQTPWRPSVDNLAAAVAWGVWRSPQPANPPSEDEEESSSPADQPEKPPSGGDSDAERSHTREAVRVLDIRRTYSSAPPGNGEPTGRTVRPHPRRGHWRRQPYGPQGSQRKWVRVPPTIVNADMGPSGPRVYRLPTPEE